MSQIAMPVRRISHDAALEIIELTQPDATATKENFYEIFGAENCLLNCRDQLDLEQNPSFTKTNEGINSRKGRRDARSSRRESRNQVLKSRKEWFSVVDIDASIRSGCGSCQVLRDLLTELFDQNQIGLSQSYEYSVTDSFTLQRRLKRHPKRRPNGPKEPVQEIQLFRPRDSGRPLKYFPDSHIVREARNSLKQVSQWLKECEGTHKNCSEYGTFQTALTRPTRLLDLNAVQQNGKLCVRVIETRDGTTYRYACLSHRWDAAVARIQTAATNIQDRLNFLELETLPQTFRDGILIARELEIGYMWIDSLCIIQEGDADANKDSEIAKMGSIYSNAVITIAAIAAENSAGGCFKQDTWPDVCLLVNDNKHGEYLLGARILDMKGIVDSAKDFEKSFPLLKRGWVLQERLLSPRLLQCNYGEFAFECLQFSQCECRSHSITPHLGTTFSRYDKYNFSRRKNLFDQRKGARDSRKYQALMYWKGVVRTYMQLQLTDTSDAFPAIAGLAQYLSQFIGSDYVAGLWEDYMTSELLWFCRPIKHKAPPKPRPFDTTAPSWSWASVARVSDIEYVESNSSPNYPVADRLLETALKEVFYKLQKPDNPFGRLETAHLELDAILYQWYIRVFCDTSSVHAFWNRKDLYIATSNPSIICHTGIQGLKIPDAVTDLNLDGKQKEEGTVFVPFDNCVRGASAHPCALAPVSLLHAHHREGQESTIDTFLVLVPTPTQLGKANCYRRIGLMTLTTKGLNRRGWNELVKDQVGGSKQQFCLF